MTRQYYLLFLMLFCKMSHAQIDLQCNGRDMHSIYIQGSQQIFRIDSVDTNPSSPISLTPTPANGGISINNNLDSTAGPETMYYVQNLGNYYYFWNGTNWTITTHTSGSQGAVNPGGTSDYIFNLDGFGNSVYRYDGTSNATLLDSNLNTAVVSAYDLATDNQGNFYIFYSTLHKIIAYDPNGIPVDSFTTSGVVSGGGGFVILGNRVYVSGSTQLYEGIRTGNNIEFTLLTNVPIFINDLAVCPQASNPLSTFSDLPLPHVIVYPNPVHEKLNILMNNNETSEVLLYNLFSQVLLHQKFINVVSLSMEQLSNGVYLYELKNKNGLIKTGKVVKY